MKKNLIKILIFLIILFSFTNFVHANVKLTENSTWQSNLTGVYHSSTVLGDLDNDGYLDLVLVGRGVNNIAKIYINNGSSFIENSTWQSNLTGAYWSSVALGDVDNDGDLDLALKGCLSSSSTARCLDSFTAKLYINNGSSLIENLTWQKNLAASSEGSLAFGDIDLDGKLDLVLVGQSASGKIAKIYINNGSSFIENSTWQANLEGIYQAFVSFGDIDNDGDLDLSFSGERTASPYKLNRIYINNDTTFVEDSTWEQSLTSIDKSSAVWCNFDNDDYLDLIMIGCCDRFFVYRNDGTTLIENQTDTVHGGDYLGGIFDGSIGVGDYDNDGDLDLVSIGRETGRNRVYENDNNIFKGDSTAETDLRSHNVQKGSLAWADVDNDSDLDLIVTGLSYVGEDPSDPLSKVYINNITTANSKPEAPNSSFNATFDDGKLILEWGNGSDAETSVLGLYYNIRVGTSSEGNDVISGIYGGGDDNGYFGNMMQRKSISIKGLDASTDYYYSIQTIDTGLMKSSWSNEQHYTTEADIINPTIEYIFPAAGYYSNKDYVHFGANVTDETDLDNVSLYGNWGGSLTLNQTNATGRNGNHTFNVSLNNGIYSWYIQACDDTGNCGETSTRTVNVDIAYCNINLTSHNNASTWSSSSTLTFTYNVSDLAIRNCSLIINNVIDQTDTSITVNTEQSFTKTLSNGDYTWSVNCTDMVNQLNSSETRTLTVDYTAPVVSSGSSTGKSGSSGFATPSTQAKAVHFYSNMNIGITEMNIKQKPERNVNKLIIHTNKFRNNVEISVETINEKPKEISKLKKNVYKYLEIKKKNIEDEDIDKAEIEFKVDKIWLNEQNALFNDILLNRFKDNIWNELPTSVLNEDNDFVYYKSISSGFSYFAVTVENKTFVEKVKEIIEEKELGIEIEEPSEVKKKKIHGLVWIFSIFFVLLVWYHYVCKLNKKNKNEEEFKNRNPINQRFG